MKTAAALVLLVLLLGNMLGLSVAVLCLETQYDKAPAATDQSEIMVVKTYSPNGGRVIETGQNQEGLYRINDQLYNIIHQVQKNDTLYTTLQVNASAWQRFEELSDLMNEVSTGKEATSPVSRTIKILNDLLKVYLPTSAAAFERDADFEDFGARVYFPNVSDALQYGFSRLHSPPPQA